VRSRVRERLRLRTPVQTTDPAALDAYAGELRPVVASLRALAEDATAPADKRVHSRVHLRSSMLKGLRELEARVDAASPPEHADPRRLRRLPKLLTVWPSRRSPPIGNDVAGSAYLYSRSQVPRYFFSRAMT
jgi:hypothetical protein